MTERFGLDLNSLVVELASNDDTFFSISWQTASPLGIEPRPTWLKWPSKRRTDVGEVLQ